MKDEMEKLKEDSNEELQEQLEIDADEKKLCADDKPSNRESFFSGFYTGAVSLATIIMIALIIIMLVTDKRIAFIDEDSSRYDYPQTNENVSKDIGNIAAKVEYISSLLSSYYLEDVDDKLMIEGIYAGMVASLGDVYSTYLSAEMYESLMAENEGVYAGIGCVVKINTKGELEVAEVTSGSAGEEAGINVGDIFVEISGTAVKDMTSNEATAMMRGEEGTKIKFKMKLKEDGSIKEYELTRKSVVVKSAEHRMLDGNIGYVRIKGFEINTVEQFDKAVDSLETEGAKGIIIDLRGNPGGVLSSVSGIADRILPKGLVVYTEDKNGKLVDKVESTDGEEIELPIVVLVDSGSASASEVLAGAIKDREAGTLVGKTTYGKGIVQSLIGLKDGSAIKLTTAKYFTPNGNYIHGKGIEPDVEVDFDSEKYYNDGIDTQLEKAIEVLKEKM